MPTVLYIHEHVQQKWGKPLVHTVSTLHGLALERFGGLTAAEIAMLHAAMSGTGADCRGEEKEGIDPASADRWGDQRGIRSDLLRWLLVDREAREHVDPRGVHVAFALIEADLDLSFIEVDFPLLFYRCALSGVVLVRGARLRAFYLTGSHIKEIKADGLCVAGDVLLNQGFQATGEVQLLGASIAGNLGCDQGKFQALVLADTSIGRNFVCQGSTFERPDGNTLIGDRLQVGGSIFLDQGFQADGEVRFLGAKIEGNLECSGGTFVHPNGIALNGDQLQVRGSIFLNQGFQAKGTVRLPGASIAGNLSCDRGQFQAFLLADATIGRNFGCQGSTFDNPERDALIGDRLQIGGDAFLDEGFQVKGTVRLAGTSITGNLKCTGTFERPSEDALFGDGLQVGGSVFLNQGFQAKGTVWLRGASIKGNLECDRGKFESLVLADATVGRNFGCQGCTFDYPAGNALVGDRLQVGGSVFLNQGFLANGEVRLLGASIAGDLGCSGGVFEHPDGNALSGDGLRVGGGVLLNQDFETKGAVRLLGVSIVGNLDCSSGTVDHPDEDALLGDGLQVGGSIFLSQGFEAKGSVRLHGASITGDLNCKAGIFERPGGNALNGEGLQVGGCVFLSQGFKAEGSVRLHGASITGNLECNGGVFNQADGNALNGDRLQIGGSVFLNQGLEVKGMVRFIGASISGNLSCSGTIEGLLLANVTIGGNAGFQSIRIANLIYVQYATITGILVWKDIHLAESARVVLSHSQVYQLDDCRNVNSWERNWPQQGKLEIDGLVYETLPENTGNHSSKGKWVDKWLKWIGLQPHYTPQPYEQLIAVLRRMGHEDEARTVAIAKQVALRKSGALGWWSSKRNWFLGFTIGHGYRPGKSLKAGAVIIVIGALFFAYGFSHGLLDGNPDHHSPLNPSQLPHLLGAMYSFDVFLPIIDFGLAAAWHPIPNGVFGWILLGYYWFEIGLGWVISTLLVLAFTNLIRKD